MHPDFFSELAICADKVNKYMLDERFARSFRPDDMRRAVLAYPKRDGKRLRPAVLMWSCGAVGGDMELSVPAAAAVEMFHTWTLVHDDVIDRDDMRRGGPTIHKMGESIAADEMGYPAQAASEYGKNLAILAGDCQHGWTVSMLCECATKMNVPADVVLAVIQNLETFVVNTLLEGELMDVKFEECRIEDLTEKDIIGMLWMKTGALYEFAARAGAMIGLSSSDTSHPKVEALAGFASSCGTAFQLQDDILGLTASEEKLGKPVGSDIREGKKTLPVFFAVRDGSSSDRDELLSIVGDEKATDTQVKRATEIVISAGGIEKTKQLADAHVKKAVDCIERVEDSLYKELLKSWADYMIDRSF